MRPRDLAALDFAGVCERIASHAVSEPGREACLALRPSAERDAAEAALERGWQCFRLLEEHGDPPLHAFPDVRSHLRTAAHEGYVLDGKSLVEVRSVLIAAREVGAFFRRHAHARPALADLPERLRPVPNLESSLVRSLDDDGGVLDQASDELAAIRAAIRRVREKLSRRLEDLVARQGMADVVAERYVTIRNDRFVVPIRAGAAARLSGVVQDRSVSGETLFVEPLFAVELNNELLMAVREEGAIVRRILADLTALLRREIDAVGVAVAALAEVDGLVARAKFARQHRCTRPSFSTGAIRLRDARHPGLLFTGRKVTPVDIELPADKRMLVITGPNTGGKTVALKTLGLSALMAQSGILVPAAEGSELPCFPAVFTDVGDEQNIERDLSTFSAHIANLREILSSPARAPLVLLDEPGVGTDPEEGAALAIGLLEHLDHGEARVLVTTHYTPVKKFALSRASCVLAAVDFEVETLTPCYRLTYHSLGRSLALPIAQRLGLPEPVLAAARLAQSEESRAFASAIEQLEDTRRRLEVELARAKESAEKLAAEEAESRRVLDELQQNRRKAWSEELEAAREFLRATKHEGRELLRELRERSEERARFERVVAEREAAIRVHVAETAAPPAQTGAVLGPPRIGDTVEVGERGIRGELLSVDGERAWIQRGSLRFEVPSAGLRRVGDASAPTRSAPTAARPPEIESAQELSLIGYRAREALVELERFLDRAVQAGHARVRVVHGIGSGALRRAVHEYLAASPYCSQFHPGERNEAVTIVEIAG